MGTDHPGAIAIAENEPPDFAAIAHARAVTIGSGSSFYWAMRLMPPARRDAMYAIYAFWAMRLMPPARRDAMYAIYAFCREADDIADGAPD